MDQQQQRDYQEERSVRADLESEGLAELADERAACGCLHYGGQQIMTCQGPHTPARGEP